MDGSIHNGYLLLKNNPTLQISSINNSLVTINLPQCIAASLSHLLHNMTPNPTVPPNFQHKTKLVHNFITRVTITVINAIARNNTQCQSMQLLSNTENNQV
jgi:hypothetical protein